jgi:hypothetical protein
LEAGCWKLEAGSWIVGGWIKKEGNEMKSKLLKVISILVVLGMVAGCGGGGGGSVESTPVPTAPPAAETENGENGEVDPEDLLPEWQETAGFTEVPMDLDGRVIRVATGQVQHFTPWDPLDSTPNETLFIMDRLRDIEIEYNMKFEFSPIGQGSSVIDEVMRARVTGDIVYEIVNMGTNHTALDGVFTRGAVMDLNHPLVRDIINFESNPWLPETRMTYMFERQYGVHFLVANSGQLLRTTITFNRNYIDRLDLPNLYDMVWNNTWNHTNFETILGQIVANSSGTIRPLVAERESQIGPGFVMAAGGLITTNTPEGKVLTALEDTHVLEATAFLGRMVAANQLTIDLENAVRWVAAGEAFMIAGDYENLRRLTRQTPPTEFDFGLLPMPKGDHLEDYIVSTHASDQFYIVADIPNPEEVAAILVAMANRLSKLNIIRTELEFGVQDNESARILEFMLERVVVDYSRLSAARNRIGDAMNQILRGDATPRQAFETFAPQIIQNYESLRPTN